MAEFDRRYGAAARSRAGAGVETLDQGLRAFMLGIYNNMAIGQHSAIDQLGELLAAARV